MLFAGKTKSGSKHLWPWWWCFFFGGTFRQRNGGYGTCYSIPSRIRRYYREDWGKSGHSLPGWIVDQSPYGMDAGDPAARGFFASLAVLWRFARCDHRNGCKCLAFPDSTELTFCTRCGRVLWCMDDGDRTHNQHMQRDRLAEVR